MSKIITPNKKPHIYSKIRELAEKEWDDQKYLEEQYETFLSAVDKGAEKDYQYKDEKEFLLAGSPKWGVNSVFEEWMRDSKVMLEFRLHELKIRKDDSSKSIPHLIGLIREAQNDGQADLVVDGIGEKMKPEDYEAFEFIVRKSLETTKKFLNDKIEIKGNILTKSQVDALLYGKKSKLTMDFGSKILQ